MIAIDIDLEAETNLIFLPIKNDTIFGHNTGSSEGNPSTYPWLFYPNDMTSVSFVSLSVIWETTIREC